MDPECYKVEILHYLNPHLIFVEVIPADEQQKSADGGVFEQIGIYGIMPLEQTMNMVQECLESRKSLVWAPAVAPIMAQMLTEAKEVWFSPTFIERRSSIFVNNIHKYGELIIKTSDNHHKKLSKMLIKTPLAYRDESDFHQALKALNLKTDIEKHEIKQVRKQIEIKYKKLLEKTSLKKDTTDSNDIKLIETELTVCNVEKHNKNFSDNVKKTPIHAKILQAQDYNVINKTTDAPITNKGREVNNEIGVDDVIHDEDDVIQTYKTTKQRLLKAVKKKANSDVTNEHKETINKCEVYEDTTDKRDEIKKGTTNLTETPHKLNKFETPHKLNKFETPHKLNKFETPHKLNMPKSPQSEMDHDVLNNSFESYAHKKSKRVMKPSGSNQKNKIPEFDENTHKLVTMGPPEIKMELLVGKVMPKYRSPNQNFRVKEKEETGAVDNILDGLDSEVNFNLSSKSITDKQCVKEPKIPVVDDSKLFQTVTKQYVTRVETFEKGIKEHYKETSQKISEPSPVLKKFTPVKDNEITCMSLSRDSSVSLNNSKSPRSSLLLNKLRRSKENNHESPSSSEIDTSAKDVSSSSESCGPNKTQNNDQGSDNETTLSALADRLDLGKKTESKASETKLRIKTNINHVNPFKNVDVGISKFVEKLISPILMVHSKSNERIQPIYNLRDVPFNSLIFSVLTNMNIKEPMFLQTVSWLTVLRGYSVFMVSPLNSGKTLGYAPAICRLIADYDVTEIPESNGPICIILCATSTSVVRVAKLCKTFLGRGRTVLSCYAGVDEHTIIITLLNGSEVLVCTPPCLVRLLDMADYSVDLRRLNTFVLDDCERLGHVYVDEIKFINLKIKEMLKKRANKQMKVQYVVASRIWCDFMEGLVKTAPDPLVCIGSFQECVLYSKSNMSVVFAKKENKIDIVLEFMEAIDKSKKTVIVCRTDEEVNEIGIILRKLRFPVFSACSTMTVEDLYRLSSAWAEFHEPVLGAVLVCCDGNLLHLNVTDAHNLLQYSMPSLFSMFSRRYAVLTDYYPSIFKNNNDTVKIKIILEADNVEQLPKIIKFLKRCSTEVPNTLDDVCEEILRQRDFIKGQDLLPVCDNLLSLGDCPNFWNCIQRHSLFKEYDVPSDDVPTSGVITFKILHYHSAITYSARLLTSKVGGKSFKFPQKYSGLSLKMGLHYSKESNRILHGIPKVGDMCAVALKESLFERCKVIKIVSKYENNGNPKEILIKLIDEEKWEKTRDIYLYHLPDDFKNINCHVVQVRFANLQPKDKDITFSDIALNSLKRITDQEDDLYIRGRVCMTIGNCIMVDDLEACQDLSSTKESVVKYNFKTILRKNHALPNPEHLPKLEQLCEKGGLKIKAEVFVEQKPNATVKELPKPRWAHLDDDLQLVDFSFAKNPSKFFVRLEKYKDCFKLLSKDIELYMKEESEKVVQNFNVGDLVIAQCSDNLTFSRARIDALIDDQNSKCFFVDYGYRLVVKNKNIVAITEKFINQMPFQAIECRLVGVKPIGSEWNEYSTNYFCDQCFVGSCVDSKKLYVKYFTKEIAECTEGHKYGIVLIDQSQDVPTIINKTLLERNLANEVENEIEYFDLELKTEEIKTEFDDDWEYETKDCKAVELYDANSCAQTNTGDISSQKLIRSVPLVTSDDEDDRWDIEFTSEELSQFFKTSQRVNHDVTSTPIGKPAITHFESEKENTERDSLSSSKLSDFEIISSPKLSIQELDSDDVTSPENTSLDISCDTILGESTLPLSQGKSSLKDSTEIKSLNQPLDKILEKTNLDITPDRTSPKQNTFNRQDKAPNKTAVSIIDDLNIHRKPKLCWSQTKTTVTIRIELIGVEVYELNIKEKHISFICDILDTKYHFDFELYGVIDTKKSYHAPKGMYIYVKLIKLLPRLWSSLHSENLSLKWIVFDPDFIEASSDEDEDFISHKEQLRKIVEKTHYEDSEDDNDDDFDDDFTMGAKYGDRSD